jgi:cytoskeletal protein CcmA (bactofilin family)
MPFSSGTFTRTFDCTTDRDNGVKILASKFDTEFDGIATGLSTCILKDGTQTCTAAIPFAQGITLPDNKTIVLGTNSDITIQYDETTNDSLEIAANVEGAALGVVLKADQGDDNADQHKLNIADGGVLTLGSKISGSFVSYLTHTPNATVADSTTAVAGNLTVGGDLTLGSGAVITEAELEAIDGVTAGTVAASKAVIVDSNKDIASFRNVTLTGELDAGSLDISGDADIDGTLEADAMTLNGTAITATATLDTGISNNNVPKFTSGVADNDFLRVDGTAIEGRSAAEVLSDIGGQAALTFGISNTNAVKIDSSSVADDEYARFTANGLESRSTSEVLSDIGAAPAAGDSNIVTTGALNSGSITSGFGAIDNGSSNITTTGVGSFGSLDISGDIDVDGTTNLDNVDIDGTASIAGHASIGVDAVNSNRALTVAGASDGSSSSILVCYNSSLASKFSVRDDGLVTVTGDLVVNGTALATTDTDTSNTGSVTLDFGANQNFVLTLTGNVTLANPSTEQVGQSGFIVFIQDGTGSRTVSLGTDYETASGAGLTLSSAASTTDIVPYVVAASGRVLLGNPQLAFS